MSKGCDYSCGYFKNPELAKQIVTEAFCKRFQDEIKSLGLRTLTIRMEEIIG